MSVKYDVLKRLEAGETVSGAFLAQELGVTRNSIWKAVGSLRQDGYTIEGQTNTGYTLLPTGDVLTVDSVCKYLQVPALQLHVYDTVGSTNTALKEWAIKGYAEGTVIIAKEQTAGKGRLGRQFHSPQNSGLYMSILLRPSFPAHEALSITTAAAVAVAQAIEAVSGQEAKIKWVNDVFVAEKKVCGILTQASINFENGGLEYAVLGIGMNVQEPQGGFAKELQGIAGAIFLGKAPAQARSKLAAEVLNRFFAIYKVLPQDAYLQEYRSRSFLTGRQVTVVVGNKQESGTVVDIDNQARLVLQLADGRQAAFSAGEANIQKKK